MKTSYLLLILISFVACKAKTDPVATKQFSPIKTECPKEGECTIELQKNKQLLLQTEKATGYLYPEITTGNNLVIVFNYNKNSSDNIADGNYSETIHFEIPSDFTELKKKNKDLADVQLLYGKHCFCEGAGYYAVSKGELIVNKQDSKVRIELTFRVEGINSEIYHIVETLDID